MYYEKKRIEITNKRGNAKSFLVNINKEFPKNRVKFRYFDYNFNCGGEKNAEYQIRQEESSHLEGKERG